MLSQQNDKGRQSSFESVTNRISRRGRPSLSTKAVRFVHNKHEGKQSSIHD